VDLAGVTRLGPHLKATRGHGIIDALTRAAVATFAD
jgi:hypothetical protein